MVMKEQEQKIAKAAVILYGCDTSLAQVIQKAIMDYYGADAPVAFGLPTQEDQHRKLGEFVIEVLNNFGSNKQPDKLKRLATQVAFLHGFTDEMVLPLVRLVRKAIAPDGDIAFAMTTKQSVHMSLEEVIAHVMEDHQYMKDNPPHN